MNNELYIIKKEDAIGHIREKLQLYTVIKTLINQINMIHPNRKSKRLTEIAEHYDKVCTRIYRSWGLPDGYVITGDENILFEYLENEFITPEDAGYIPCDSVNENSNKTDEKVNHNKFISEITGEFMNTFKDLFDGCVDIHIHIE